MSGPGPAAPVRFGDFVAAAQRAGRLVVQPRMGFSDVERMRHGLLRTKEADAVSAGTLTIDSYTRLGQWEEIERALADGVDLNGYPIVTYAPGTTLGLLDGIRDPGFPVQVRHGSPHPQHIFRRLVETGLEATEGGPVSYCLPYSRTPLRQAVAAWEEGTRILAGGAPCHMETFGGCLLGQLCPPSLLVAVSLLEGIFFHRHGIRSLSLSYAQQTQPAQDEEAVLALRSLAAEYLPGAQWHVVFYAYMGVYPRTVAGAHLLLAQAARTAVRSGAARLIVKTEAEAHRIPTVAENVAALEAAARAAEAETGRVRVPERTGVLEQARGLVEAVVGLHEDIGEALCLAFERGILDVPFCLHPDNRGRTRSRIDGEGRIRWLDTGDMPVTTPPDEPLGGRLTADELLFMLHHMEQRYDRNGRSDSLPDHRPPHRNGDDHERRH
ncbi:Glutamate mutase epsilon subunit [Nocardiopsis dassonvillei]|uniref:methylaspartate mutase n=1 Tax=Nocardiopsis dassonvillei TaxID=2014 RepID=UPI003F54B6AA